jgi:hypothetical protein
MTTRQCQPARRCWCLLSASLVAIGCAPATDAVPAGGIVTLDGQAVEGATVSFLPRDSSKQGAYGKTGADGRFRLQTYGVDDGAVPGDYDVTIQKVQITPDEFDRDDPRWTPPPPPKYLVPKKYSDRDKSGLAASVVKGKKNEFPFDLQK